MRELIYGTTNPAKLAQVKAVLEPYGFSIKSLADFNRQVTVVENGRTAEANARKKAAAYADALHMSVLSMDVAFYIKGLPDHQQPGLHVRRLRNGKSATDQELVEYYVAVAKKLGGRADTYWRYAFAIARPSGGCVSFVHDSPRILVSKPDSRIVEGFPVESLLLDPATGRYISAMSENEVAEFWRKTVGSPLARFVRENY